MPVLIFTNPDDIFEGKTSYWLKEIEELQFIETPTKEKKGYFINKKKCTVIGKNWKDQVIDVRPADLLEPLYNETRDYFLIVIFL